MSSGGFAAEAWDGDQERLRSRSTIYMYLPSSMLPDHFESDLIALKGWAIGSSTSPSFIAIYPGIWLASQHGENSSQTYLSIIAFARAEHD